jgi:hypothetical protein
MGSQNPNISDLSVSMREAMFAAWLQDQLPILLAAPSEPDSDKPEEKVKVN